MAVVSFNKDAKVALSDVLLGSAVGALGAGLIILANKFDILERKFNVMCGLTECNTLLIQSLNNDLAKLSDGKTDSEKVES